VWTSLGYKSGKAELSKKKFFEFLKIISPSIAQETSDYIFNKVDIDRNGTISRNEIEQTMNENSIMISVINQTIPGFVPSEDNSETFKPISENTTYRIKECFKQLMEDIRNNKYTLLVVFNKYSKVKKGSINK
jgi:hypothetical protein